MLGWRCTMQRNGHDIIVIGGSAGALEPLKIILSKLPADFPGAVLMVLHLSPHAGSGLVGALHAATPLTVTFASDRAPIRHGHLYMAPPDYHLVVKTGHVLLTHGPRENLWRPAIDVLFRSAAVAYGSRVVGVVLSGALDDGSAGLSAVKRCGGVAIAQSPDDARVPDMPESAIRNAAVDHVLPASGIADRIQQLISEAPGPTIEIPRDLALEAQVAETGVSSYELNQSLGELSEFTCSECAGPLWRREGSMLRFRCLTGHALTARNLDEGLSGNLDSALWAAIRQFEQRANLYLKQADVEDERGRGSASATYRDRADEARGHANALRNVLLQAAPASAA
jgi:two-component system chemotaxis response regulator CheB